MPTPDTFTQFDELDDFMSDRALRRGPTIWFQHPHASVARAAEAAGLISSQSATQVYWTEAGAAAIREWREVESVVQDTPLTVMSSLALDAAADALVDLLGDVEQGKQTPRTYEVAVQIATTILEAVMNTDEPVAATILTRKIAEKRADLTSATGLPFSRLGEFHDAVASALEPECTSDDR